MIVVVGGIKGGCGKTTLATNLAVMCSHLNQNILLVDADELMSSTYWSHQRESEEQSKLKTIPVKSIYGKYLYKDVQKLKNEFEHIIIDVGGRDTTSQRSAMTIADIFLIPFRPRSLDIWTVDALKELIKDCKDINKKVHSLAILNQADSRGVDNFEALQILEEVKEFRCLGGIIGYRKIYGNASSFGMGVIEYPKKDKIAISEMKYLYASVFGNKGLIWTEKSM